MTVAPARAFDKASDFYKQGTASLKAKKYDQAYQQLRAALQLKPDNVEYQLATQHAQFAAANGHIQNGEKYKAAKQYPEAMAEFQHAAEIDPSNFVANQEIEAITELLHPQPAPGEAVDKEAANALDSRLALAGGPVELGQVANTIVKDFVVNSDAKSAYESAAKLAGLNVIFDSSQQGSYTNSTRVNLALHDISLLQILHVLDVETNSFYVPVTSNTILVANSSLPNHQQVDPTVLKVFYVKNVQAPTDLTELAQTIRGLMQPQPHIMPVGSINALVMRDTPDKVAMVQRLLDELDKAPPEVVVDIRILQVNHDLARDLGLLPPTSFGIGLAAPATSASTTSTSTTTGTDTTTGTTNSPTLNELTHLNSSNFSVTIPNATLNALLSNNNTETIQEPQLRAVQGVKAQLLVGEQIPTATGSFQPGIGGVGINPLVNTQFTYQNIGVTLDVTPEIHSDNTVLLKNHIEIKSLDGFNNIGGIQQPVFGNNVIDHTIELRNGESAVLGGMMVNTVQHNNQGIPGFNSVPLFKWLFSTTHDETIHNEILVVMTPHIVRQLDVTPTDLRALDTGTQDNIELRELPPATTVEPPEAEPMPRPAAAAPTPATTAAAPRRISTPAPVSRTPIAAPAAASATPGTPATLEFAPSHVTAVAGKTFQVVLNLNDATNAYAVTFQLNYDPKLLQVTAMNLGPMMSRDGQAPALVHRENATEGTAQVSLSRPPNVAGISGSGELLTITFTAKGAGTSPVSISRLGARGPGGALMPMKTTPTSVTVK